MFKIQNIEIAIAVFLSMTMVSCFGTDTTPRHNSAEFTKEEMTVLPSDDLSLEIDQDITIDTNYKFTN